MRSISSVIEKRFARWVKWAKSSRIEELEDSIGCVSRPGPGVGFGGAEALEGERMAEAGVREDLRDRPDLGLRKAVDGLGAGHALVADLEGDDPPAAPAAGGLDYGTMGFLGGTARSRPSR